MWTGFILSTIFGAIIMGFLIWGIVDCYKPECPMDRDAYRYKIEKEPYDGISWFGDKFYNREMSEEQNIRYNEYSKKVFKKGKIKKRLSIYLVIIAYIFIVCISSYFGAFLSNENLAREVEKYKANKYTIETSLQNNNLTGLERIELVKQASEQNSWLAEKRYEVQQWYNFYLNKDIVVKLELIDLYKGE